MSMKSLERSQSAGPTPRTSGTYTAFGETPRLRAGKSKYVNLSSQKFQVAHQQVNLDIDLSKKHVSGYTELSIVPTADTLRAVSLDARALSIKKITVNGNQQTDYVYNDTLFINNPETFELCATQRLPNLWDVYSSEFGVHQHHLLRSKLSHIFGHLDDDDNNGGEKWNHLNTGELIILLPEDLKMELADVSTSHQTPMSTAPTASLTPGHIRTRPGFENYNPIQIGIEYEVINPKDGLHFVSGPNMDRRAWHVYTSNSEYNVSASSWVPCIDNLLARSSWSVELSIPRSVKDIIDLAEKAKPDGPIEDSTGFSDGSNTDNPYATTSNISSSDSQVTNASEPEIEIDDYEDEKENYDLTVCSGDVNNTKESPHPTNPSKKLVSWSVFNPVCAHHIGWAVGAFQSLELSDFDETPAHLAESEDEFESMEKDETSSSVSLFYLPGQADLVKNTCIFAQKALDFFSKEYGSYPFSSYGVAFIQDPRFPRNNFAGLSLLSADILYPATIIEPMFTTTEDILECIACQWSGISIVPSTINDLWCVIGIAKFMTFQFTKLLVGTNEFKFQMKNKMSAIIEEDIGQRPLGFQAFQAPISESDFSFIRLKAPMILFILDRRMTKTDKSFGFTRVLPKLFLQAMSGDLPNGALSTSHFQYVCEKVNRNRLESFFKQWIYGIGTPIFNITQKFNKKRSLIEVVIRQSQLQQVRASHPKSTSFARDAAAYLNQEQTFPVQQTFLGPMTIRVHEADGTPYEHIVDIKDKVVKFDVQYNTKFKRLKKSKEESSEGASNFSKLGDILQTEEDIKHWSLEEWPKRDEEYLDPFEWLRVDTDSEWIATFNLNQPDYMFGSQLQQDRDVEAQIAACEFFGRQEKPLTVHCTVLTRTLMDKRYFYGVRIAAARALSRLSQGSNKFYGLSYLIRAFKTLFCFSNSMIPKNNNFQDFGEFFVQMAMPGFIANIKDEKGNSPLEAKKLLLNLLRYNDNSNNDFEDCFYVAALVKALVRSVIPINEDGSLMTTSVDTSSAYESESKNQNFIRQVIEEIERLQKLDLWVPSYQSLVSSTCLEQRILMTRSRICDFSLGDLLHHTHPKKCPRQRILAFEGLLILGGLKNAEILRYFLDVCLLENISTTFQAGMISALMRSVSEAAIQGLPSALDDPEFEATDGAKLNDSLPRSNMIVVEESQTSEMNSRRDAFARATVKGAIEIVRRDLSMGTGLQKILWELLHTSLLSHRDKKTIFLLCDILYEATASFPVTISVPCVPFDELKKKIVAKISGGGIVTIKREARFKIQLSAKVSNNLESKLKLTGNDGSHKTTSSQLEQRRNESITAPKLKLKISNSVENEKQEMTKPTPEASISYLVSRDPRLKTQVKIKLNKRRLEALIPKRKVIEWARHEGATVKIKFGDQNFHRKIIVSKREEKPLRYVRIYLEEKRIELASEPFLKNLDNMSRAENAQQSPRTVASSSHEEGVSTKSEADSNKYSIASVDKGKNDLSDAHEEREHEQVQHEPVSNGGLRKPTPSKSYHFGEVSSEKSRAASPFSKEPSPSKSTKRRKTKIYIHGRSSSSPSPADSSHEVSNKTASPELETNPTNNVGENESNVAIVGREVVDSPAEEPRRKLKLKLSLK